MFESSKPAHLLKFPSEIEILERSTRGGNPCVSRIFAVRLEIRRRSHFTLSISDGCDIDGLQELAGWLVGCKKY